VADVIVNGGWDIPSEVFDAPGVADRLDSIVIPCTYLLDSLFWSHSTDGKLSAKQAFAFLDRLMLLFLRLL
jgi:hypothetical protein